MELTKLLQNVVMTVGLVMGTTQMNVYADETDSIEIVSELPPTVLIPGAYGDGVLGKITVLSEEPRIFLIEHFLTDEECDHLIKRAKPMLQRSTVVSDTLENGNINQLHDARTSRGMFLEKPTKDPILRRVEKRIAALTQLPEDNGEGMQVLSYGLNAEYKPHYDYFDQYTPGGAACYNRGGQRIATVVMYLADTEEGGETFFPFVDVSARPVKGNAVLFYSCTPDGVEDPLSFHGSAPVISGEKWVAIKWIRQNKFY